MPDCPAMPAMDGDNEADRKGMNGMENNVVWNGAGQHGCMQAVAGLLHIGMREPFSIEGVVDTSVEPLSYIHHLTFSGIIGI